MRLGRYGPMAQIGTKDDEEKPEDDNRPDDNSTQRHIAQALLTPKKFLHRLGLAGQNEVGPDMQ